MRILTAIFSLVFILFATPLLAAETVTIGLSAPLTGDNAMIGEQVLQGAKLAVDKINQAGGVLGRQIKLQPEDDACDPKQAVAVANKIVADRIQFVVGPACSGAAIPASDIYQEAGTVMMSPVSSNPSLTDTKKWNVFRLYGRTDTQAVKIADLIAKMGVAKRVAILYDSRDVARSFASQLKQELAGKKITPVLYESYAAGSKDYHAIVSRLKEVKADIIMLASYLGEAGLIVRQSHEQNIQPQFIGFDTLANKDFWSITGGAGEGTLYISYPEPRKSSANAATNAEFKARKFEPDGYTYIAYAVVQSWAQAAEKAKIFDGKAIAKALKENHFDTAAGNLGFDPKGDVVGLDWTIYQWSKGSFDYYKK